MEVVTFYLRLSVPVLLAMAGVWLSRIGTGENEDEARRHLDQIGDALVQKGEGRDVELSDPK